jgi:hypothetical protein
MKTRLLACVLLVASLSAHAYTEGSTEELNSRMEICKDAGRMGQLDYKMALQGKATYSSDSPSNGYEMMMRHIEDDIFTNYQAYDEKMAFMHAATYCLDNLNRLGREFH